MALIIDMANFTSPLMLTHTKKQESKDLYHPCPSKQLHSFSQLTSFTGWVCPNSTMTYSLSTGHPRRNTNNTLLAIRYHHFLLCMLKPLSSASTYNIPRTPSISRLTTAIIRSVDKLLFISNPTGSNEAWEQRLVRVAFQESMLLYPLCLQDGRFLVKFYICHPADSCYNAVNQSFWLQYHMDSDLHSSLSRTKTHLISPPMLWLTMLPAISYLHSKNGWTWHITTLSFTAPLNFPLSMAAKHKILSHKWTGMSSDHIATCSTTHYHVSMFRLIQFTLTAERMYCFVIQPLPIN